MKTDTHFKAKHDSKLRQGQLPSQGFAKFTNEKGVPYSEFHKQIKGDVQTLKKAYINDASSLNQIKPSSNSSQKKKQLASKVIDVNELNSYFSNHNSSQRQEYLN